MVSSARANRTLWIAWLLATVGLVVWLAYVMLGDATAKTLFSSW